MKNTITIPAPLTKAEAWAIVLASSSAYTEHANRVAETRRFINAGVFA